MQERGPLGPRSSLVELVFAVASRLKSCPDTVRAEARTLLIGLCFCQLAAGEPLFQEFVGVV